MKKRELSNFGKNVLTLLDKRNLKISDMEQDLNYAIDSIEKNYIYGTRTPGQVILELVSNYFMIEPEKLLNGKIWLDSDIEKLEQEFRREDVFQQEELHNYSRRIYGIVPKPIRTEIHNEQIEEMSMGELLVAKRKARNLLYWIAFISAILFVKHPNLTVKLIFGMVMCFSAILLNYTIKNKKRIDMYLERFIRVTFCIECVIGLGGILVTF